VKPRRNLKTPRNGVLEVQQDTDVEMSSCSQAKRKLGFLGETWMKPMPPQTSEAALQASASKRFQPGLKGRSEGIGIVFRRYRRYFRRRGLTGGKTPTTVV